MGLFFSSRKPGITPSEMKDRAFHSGVGTKVARAIKQSGNSYANAKKKSGAVLGVISGALASGYGKKNVAESKEVLAGLDALKANHVISEKEYKNVSSAIRDELKD